MTRALTRTACDPAEDPTWELFCLEHNMHELAQDDEKSELAPSHRPLRGVALGLFTAMVTRIIPTPNLERAITHRRLSETARRAEIRNQRAILRTVSGETGDSFPRLKLKSHSPCGDAY